jgi:hypothetical protein
MFTGVFAFLTGGGTGGNPWQPVAEWHVPKVLLEAKGIL